MFDRKKAAEYFVVAWVKDWPLWQYAAIISEVQDTSKLSREEFIKMMNEAREAYAWMPQVARQSKVGIRQLIGAGFPKLSAWLFAHSGSDKILLCAPQIEKLVWKHHRGYVTDADRKEMVQTTRDEKQMTASYRISRDRFKTHQRSAWNVCK